MRWVLGIVLLSGCSDSLKYCEQYQRAWDCFKAVSRLDTVATAAMVARQCERNAK